MPNAVDKGRRWSEVCLPSSLLSVMRMEADRLNRRLNPSDVDFSGFVRETLPSSVYSLAKGVTLMRTMAISSTLRSFRLALTLNRAMRPLIQQAKKHLVLCC